MAQRRHVVSRGRLRYLDAVNNASTSLESDRECRRCAACCRAGGPALHAEDAALYRAGVLTRADLITYRKGELVRENVRGGLVRLEAEIVKIRGSGGGFACRFLDQAANLCAIHENRPAECRALLCRDTGELEAMYERGRIGRLDLIPPQSALGELILEHEQHCDLVALGKHAQAYRDEGDADARRAIFASIRYDRELRELMTERAGMSPEEAAFLLGRQLSDLLASVGLGLAVAGQTATLVAISTGDNHARR